MSCAVCRVSLTMGRAVAERIENADDLLETFLENFQDENSTVQLQLLTSCVKLFLKKPKTTQNIVQVT